MSIGCCSWRGAVPQLDVVRVIGAAPELTTRDLLAEPDMGVLRLNRRTPPKLPIEVFGPVWAPWITTAAQAAACPPDYVAAPLLASASGAVNSRSTDPTVRHAGSCRLSRL